MFDVIWVAGERDGELLGSFDKKSDAVNFAYEFERKHEQEFDLICGGVAIIDLDTDTVLEWW